MCRLDCADGVAGKGLHCSLTHLIAGPGTPLAHEIAAYQKHRTRRSRRSQA